MICIGYYSASRAVEAWRTRLLGLWFLCYGGTMAFCYLSPLRAKVTTIEHFPVFLIGSVSGILFYEMEAARAITLIRIRIDKPFRLIVCEINWFSIFTWGLDILCYVTVALMALSPLPHLKLLSPGLYKAFGGDREFTNAAPFFAAIILMALTSNKSFSKLFHWNFLTFAGKISYSIYIFHPVALAIIFDTLRPLSADTADAATHLIVEKDTVENVFVMRSFLVLALCWAIGGASYLIIEETCAKLSRYLTGLLPKISNIPALPK
jgi:peptidoglycan/LPS O-acetylase OafA/YrhL